MEKLTIIQDDHSGRLARKEKAHSLIHMQQKKKRQWQHNCIPTGNVPIAKRDEVPLLMRQQLILKSPDETSVNENLCYVNMGFNYTTLSNSTSPDVYLPTMSPSFASLHDQTIQVIDEASRNSSPLVTPSKNVMQNRKSSIAFSSKEEQYDSPGPKSISEEIFMEEDSKDIKESGNIDGDINESHSSHMLNGNLTNNNIKPKEVPLINDLWAYMSLDNLHEFVMMPPPMGTTIQCRLERDKYGIDKNIFPIYSLFLDIPNKEKTLIMAARKRMKSTTSYYVISTNALDISKKDGENFIGKLRSNLIGTQFVLYDSGLAPNQAGYDTNLTRKELASVVYESNILGFNGPRNMTVIIPSISTFNQRYDHRPLDENDSLHAMWKKKDRLTHIIALRNKSPIWNADTQSFVLNFNGRVTLPSVKNFQIVQENDVNSIVLQFGRIGEDRFTLDYSFPMCAFQAFGIALSSIDKKMACE